MYRFILFQILKESLFFAYHSLKVNKLRTFLSLLGITIGIFAIISVFTVIDSLENSIRSRIASLGDNVIYIQKWPWTPPPGESEYPWWKYLKRPVPKIQELDEIKSRSQKAKAICFAIKTFKTIQYEDNYIENVILLGISQDYENIRAFDIERGRYYSAFEQISGKNCAILGPNIADKLFQNQNPIGKEIKIMGHKVQVVGIFKREGKDLLGDTNDDLVMIPINYARNIVDIRNDRLNPMVIAKAKSTVSTDEITDELRGIMRSIHRLRPMEEDDFALNQSSMLTQVINSIFSVIDFAGIIIGGFSILVGGFGIANIMFVSVKEQTHLIGIQKALGAKNFFILSQFLYESVILCIIGGAIGLLFIYIGTIITEYLTDMIFALTLTNVMRGLLISIAIGLISGILPAITASKLNPVEAMNTN